MKVKTIEPVQYDGKNIKPGTFVEVTEDAAAQLIASGAAEAVGKARRDSAAGNDGDGQSKDGA